MQADSSSPLKTLQIRFLEKTEALVDRSAVFLVVGRIVII